MQGVIHLAPEDKPIGKTKFPNSRKDKKGEKYKDSSYEVLAVPEI
jgi:hypothetical protein